MRVTSTRGASARKRGTCAKRFELWVYSASSASSEFPENFSRRLAVVAASLCVVHAAEIGQNCPVCTEAAAKLLCSAVTPLAVYPIFTRFHVSNSFNAYPSFLLFVTCISIFFRVQLLLRTSSIRSTGHGRDGCVIGCPSCHGLW